MLAVFDLSSRQAARVLEQALRSRSTLILEPRSRTDGLALRVSLAGRDENRLIAALDHAPDVLELLELVGVCCDARLSISGNLYLFDCSILDVREDSSTLIITTPDAIQLVNRRRFNRTEVAIACQVRIWTNPDEPPSVGLVSNLSVEGLGVDVPGKDIDERLLVGDVIRVSVELPGFDESFQMPATVCSKKVDNEQGQVSVGLEFYVPEGATTAQQTLQRYQAALIDLTDPRNAEGGE